MERKFAFEKVDNLFMAGGSQSVWESEIGELKSSHKLQTKMQWRIRIGGFSCGFLQCSGAL
jgi:hypothetical protein